MGVEVTFLSPVKSLLYAYAGNGYNPNHMMFLGQGQTHGRQFFPPGLGFSLPKTGAASHLTLHSACSDAAEGFQAFYTIYYKPQD